MDNHSVARIVHMCDDHGFSTSAINYQSFVYTITNADSFNCPSNKSSCTSCYKFLNDIKYHQQKRRTFEVNKCKHKNPVNGGTTINKHTTVKVP